MHDAEQDCPAVREILKKTTFFKPGKDIHSIEKLRPKASHYEIRP